MTLEKKIETFIKPPVKKAGYEIVKIELRFQKRNQVLTVTINKKGGLSAEDCAKVSRLIDPILEKENLIKQKYYLIVSSPGI